MSNPWMGRFGTEQKVSLKALAKGNGKAEKPSLAGLKRKPLPKRQNKRDFYHEAVLFWNAKILGEVTKGYRDGVSRPYGSVDVSNGDTTYTLHNLYGAWMCDVDGATMAEPALIASWLGISMGQVEMHRQLQARFEAELKAEGITTLADQRRAVEENQRVARSRAAAKQARAKDNTPNPWMKGLKT